MLLPLEVVTFGLNLAVDVEGLSWAVGNTRASLILPELLATLGLGALSRMFRRCATDEEQCKAS